MKKVFLNIIVLMFLCNANAQNPDLSKQAAMDYIKNYYSDFQTGFDYDGKYITVTNNYKATFSNREFELTYDKFDTDSALKKQHQSVKFNFNDIESMEPLGMDNATIYGNETIYIPLNAKLLFKKGANEYYINIYYEVEGDVTKSKIYRAFEVIRNSYKKTKT
jgi:hypothetical protein